MADVENTELAKQSESTFDPILWLARFEAVGGFVWLAQGGLQIGWAIHGYTEAHNCAARAIYKEVQNEGERLEAIAALIDAKAFWRARLSELEAIEALPNEGMNDETFDRAGDLASELIGTPAPDREALRWKLDHFLACREGSESYESSYLAQTIADYRRFLRAA